MTYSEKLKDPRWFAFRDDFIARNRRNCDDPAQCCQCGEDTAAPLQVHHRRYYPERDPWDYDDTDLLLICKECHEQIHRLENRVRDLVRSLEPHECYEMDALIEVLEKAHSNKRFKVAAARAKNAVRTVCY